MYLFQHPHVVKFSRSYDVLDIGWAHEQDARYKLQTAGTSNAQIISASRMIKCEQCGVFGEVILTFKQRTEPEYRRRICCFAFGTKQLIPLTRDHVLPKSLGGTDGASNMRLLCQQCNAGRGNAVTDEEMHQIFQNLHNHLSSSLPRFLKFVRYLKRHHPATFWVMFVDWLHSDAGHMWMLDVIRTIACSPARSIPVHSGTNRRLYTGRKLGVLMHDGAVLTPLLNDRWVLAHKGVHYIGGNRVDVIADAYDDIIVQPKLDQLLQTILDY